MVPPHGLEPRTFRLVSSGQMMALTPWVGGAQDEMVSVVSAAIAAIDATENATAAIPVISACFIVRFPPLIFIMLNFPARCRKRDVGSCPPIGHHRQDKAAALRWLNPAAISAEVSCKAMAYLAMA